MYQREQMSDVDVMALKDALERIESLIFKMADDENPLNAGRRTVLFELA